MTNRILPLFGVFNAQTGALTGFTISGNAAVNSVLGNVAIASSYPQVRQQLSSGVLTVLATGQVTQADGAGGTFVFNSADTTSGAWFVGSMSGSVLTVTLVNNGTLAVGQYLNRGDTGATIGTITSFGTGAGGTGTYNISASATIGGPITFTTDNNETILVGFDGSRWYLAPDAAQGAPSQLATYGTDSGVANAYVFTHIPPLLLPSISVGTLIRFIALTANTGPSTINVDGNGVQNIVGRLGQPLLGGEILTTLPTWLQYIGANKWQIFGSGITTVGNILDYGADPTGVADSTSAINTTLTNHAGGAVYIPAGTFKTTAALNVASANTLIYGAGMGLSIISATNATGNQFNVTANQCTMRDFSITVTVSQGTIANIGAINLNGANNCLVTNVEISGVSWAGIYVSNAASKNIIDGCNFHNFSAPQFTASITLTVMTVTAITANTGSLVVGQVINGAGIPASVTISSLGTGTGGTGTYNISSSLNIASEAMSAGVSGGSDIILSYNTGNCAYNMIRNNRCFGGNWMGIQILANDHSDFNIMEGNRIGMQASYGGLDYTNITTTDRFNQWIGNYIENIQGTTLGGTSGAGLYLAGVGGDVIANNEMNNCCVQTTTETLAPGGIGINGTAATSAPVNVTGNLIANMTKFHGIDVVSCAGPVNLVGNSILHPASNSTGCAFKIGSSSLTSVIGNLITCNSGQQGILVQGSTGPFSNLTISENSMTHSGGNGIVFSVTGGTQPFTLVIVKGNNIQSIGNHTPLQLAGIAGGVVANNILNNGSNASAAMTADTSTNIMYTDNWIQGGSSVAAQFSGTSTGSFVDKSNYIFSAASARIGQQAVNNSATGVHVETLGTVAPTVGTSATGDTVWNSAGTYPTAWIASTGGSPGTWTATSAYTQRVTIAYAASMTPNAAQGNVFEITATNNTAFTINNPTNPTDGQRITIRIFNTSGGALGAITFGAAYKMSAFIAPATANNRSIDFEYNSTATSWYQTSPENSADVPN